MIIFANKNSKWYSWTNRYGSKFAGSDSIDSIFGFSEFPTSKHHLLSLLFLNIFFQYFAGWANVKSRKRSGDIIRYYCATFVKLFAPLLAFTETWDKDFRLWILLKRWQLILVLKLSSHLLMQLRDIRKIAQRFFREIEENLKLLQIQDRKSWGRPSKTTSSGFFLLRGGR